MRILHVSDVHCATENLVRVLESESYDLVVASGDFECEDSARALVDAGVKAVAVTGNMDHAGITRILREAGILIDGEVVEVEGLKIAGAGGLDPLTSISMLRSKASGPVDVLVTHHPPRGVVDRVFTGIHAGLEEVKELIEELKPRVHLCGHIHEARGVGRVGDTIVVNAGPLKSGYYAVVELDGDVKVTHLRV
ncbi:metallophosphoesterase family protein [Stetteria hydrogenophila]